jgi:SAM-dependent methyltransferase
VGGLNPDVDTPADLAALLEAAWNRRVAENREQVDRFRERPDGPDFYAPVSAMFRVDPDRRDDLHLDALAALVQPGETVLDIGCGAGRFALPLARRAGVVIAVDPSSSMLEALREDASHHGILNVRAVAGRWPAAFPELSPSGKPIADLSFIAHVGYDVEPIGPFLEAMEAAARRRCVALLTEPAPASLADPFWPAVHGERRIALPAAELLVELLTAHGRRPTVEWMERPPRGYASSEELHRFLRHQLWVEPDGEKDHRLAEAIRRLAEPRGERWYIREETPGRVALIDWEPSQVV